MSENDERYLGTVVEAEITTLRSGKEVLSITLEIESKGRMEWLGFFHTEGARRFTENALRNLDFGLAERDYDLETCCREIVGRKATCVLELDEYKGRRQWRVRYINRLGSSGQQKMSPDGISKLRDRLRQQGAEDDSTDAPF